MSRKACPFPAVGYVSPPHGIPLLPPRSLGDAPATTVATPGCLVVLDASEYSLVALEAGGKTVSEAWFSRRVFLIALALSLAGVATVPRGSNEPRPTAVNRATSVDPEKPRDEVLAVLIASSACPGSKVPGFRRAVHVIALKLHADAQQRHLSVFMVGVALDDSVEQGLHFLSALGRFDEVVAGMYARNLAVQEYIAGPFPGPLTVPQMVILRRTTQFSHGRVTFANARVLYRAVGGDKIVALSRRSALLGGQKVTESPNDAH